MSPQLSRKKARRTSTHSALLFAIMLAAGVLLQVTASSHADETDIVLKDGKGRDAVVNNCGACHSLDYVKMNSPFLDKAGWDGEVTKMIKAYGAPIDDADAKEISAYLAANYGK
ncbi:MAG: cytochrome c [Hyphomicrobiales bacterium]|nr:cytochrome c [Hyphomicrobiales bacterium]MBV9139160.1 cytochrome c [Hyphomicrobiales bacterium]MBV9974935.1 cytochrome c [Hyphomicrobiales bacterium]